MSGKAIRRRAKLVKSANQGNLAKAQRGKASANLPLPNAPTKEDYTEKVPASLKRLMALKAAADQPQGKRQKVDGLKAQQLNAEQPKQQQPQAEEQQQQLDKHTAGKAGASKATEPEAPKLQTGVIWEQPKKLKQRKKEYLKAKKLKKKGKRLTAADESAPVDRPAFGEVVHAPPKVQLKRKHWDTAAAAKAKHQQQQQQQQKQKHKIKPHHQPQPATKHKQDAAMLELREQVIKGYRAGRGPREGHATLTTLKQLVK